MSWMDGSFDTTGKGTTSRRRFHYADPIGINNPWKGKAGSIWQAGTPASLGMPGRTLESLAYGGGVSPDTIAQGIINTLGIPGYEQDVGGREGSQLYGTDRDELYDWWQGTFLPAYRDGVHSFERTGGATGADDAKIWDPEGEKAGWSGLETAFGNLPPSLPSFDQISFNFDEPQINTIWSRLQDIQDFDPNMPDLSGLGTNVTNIYDQLYGVPGSDKRGIQDFEITDALRQLFPGGELYTGADTVSGLLDKVTDWDAPASIGTARDDAARILGDLQAAQGTFSADEIGLTDLINQAIDRSDVLGRGLDAIKVPDITTPYNQIVKMSDLLPGVTDELNQITGMSEADRDLMGVLAKLVSGQTPTAGELQTIVTALTPELDPYQVTTADLTMPTSDSMLKAISQVLPGADKILGQLDLPDIGVSDLAMPTAGDLRMDIARRLPGATAILDEMPFDKMIKGDLLERMPFSDITSDNLIDLLPGVDPIAYKDAVLSLMPDISAGDLSLPEASNILERLTMPDAKMMLGQMPFKEISGTDILDRLPGVSPLQFEEKILSLMPKIEAGDLSLPEADDLLTALPFDEVTKNDLLDQFVQSPMEFQQALLDWLPKVTAADLDLPTLEAGDLGLPTVTAADMKRLGVLPSLGADDLGLPTLTGDDIDLAIDTDELIGDPIAKAISSAVAELGDDSPFDLALKAAKNRITDLEPTIDAVSPQQLLGALEDPFAEIGPEGLLGAMPFDKIQDDQMLNAITSLFPETLSPQVNTLLSEAMPESLLPQISALLPGKDDVLGAIEDRLGQGLLPSDVGIDFSGQDLMPGDLGIDFSKQGLLPSDVGIDFSGQDLLPGDVGINFSGEDQLNLLRNLGLDFSGISSPTELGLKKDVWEDLLGFKAAAGPLAEFIGGMDQNFWGNLEDVLEGRITTTDFNDRIRKLTEAIESGRSGKPVVVDDEGEGRGEDGDPEMASDWNTWLKGLQDQITKSYGRDPSEFGTGEGETYADWLRADPITASLIDDFEAEAKKGRAQLTEDLSRMGLLQTSTDTADAFGEFDAATLRGRGDVLSDAAKRMQDLRTAAMDRGTTLADTMSRHDISVGDLTGWFGDERTIRGEELDLDKLAVAIASLNPDLKLDDSPEGVQRAIFEIMLDSLGGNLSPEYLQQLRDVLKEERPEGAGGGNWFTRGLGSIWGAIEDAVNKVT